jgi:hypothetical protein
VKIKVAHFLSKGTYVAKACVQYSDGVKTEFRTALGDTADEAINGAVDYICADRRKDGLPVPAEIERVGKIRRVFAEAWSF